jgi:predicted alpha/beta superfamily hydrolase
MWQDYQWETDSARAAVGRVRLLRDVWSPQLENARDLLVYLPPSHGQVGRRFPVIYMHDGQNLFDAATSFAGEWRVDETMETLAQNDGLEAIVVGIPNISKQRVQEYSPFKTARKGKGDLYLQFILETIKPIIDRDFLTLPDRSHTGIVGSSMGGLISLYGFFRYPEAFGFVGALSPALWFAGRAIFPFVERTPYAPGRIYLDAGAAEQRGLLDDTRRMHRLLLDKGYGDDVMYVEDADGTHHESAWARRLPAALRFLLGKNV